MTLRRILPRACDEAAAPVPMARSRFFPPDRSRPETTPLPQPAASRRLCPGPYHHLVLIGASTGGTRVLPEILSRVRDPRPAVLVVQHMPRYINASVVRTLARYWPGPVRLAEEGDGLEDGLLLVAPSEVHCTLIHDRRIHLEAGPPVNCVCPAIDVTMRSVQAPLPAPVTGVLLTGMGRDGAEGMLHLKGLGARTLAQDAVTCAVYGMPAEAVKLGAVDRQGPPEQIAAWLGRPGELPPPRE
jgi:two-component system, chemotaxis family, protein-glutamate methylesterase/glutaminase